MQEISVPVPLENLVEVEDEWRTLREKYGLHSFTQSKMIRVEGCHKEELNGTFKMFNSMKYVHVHVGDSGALEGHVSTHHVSIVYDRSRKMWRLKKGDHVLYEALYEGKNGEIETVEWQELVWQKVPQNETESVAVQLGDPKTIKVFVVQERIGTRVINSFVGAPVRVAEGSSAV